MVLEHSHLPFYMLLIAYKPTRIYMYFRFLLAKNWQVQIQGGNPIIYLYMENEFPRGKHPLVPLK